MSEEKKKRWRPSLTAYRALENEVSVLREENRLLSRGEKNSSCDVSALEKSNRLMEKELIARGQRIMELEERCSFLVSENRRLMDRGFLSRLFNRK